MPMPSPAEQLDQARNDELLDLTLRNPLISHRMRTSRGLAVVGARPVALYNRLVAQERTLRFRPLGQPVAPEAPDEAQPLARASAG